MTFSKIFGLPAHPLFVHVPIARVRDRYGWLVLAIGIIAGLSTQFAIESGQALRHSVPQSAALHRHVHIASQIRPLILLLFLGTNVRLLQIGDRGAKATWQRVHLRKDAPRDRTGGN